MSRPRCFTVDELRAAGALDVPEEWRRSLSAGTSAGQKRPSPQRSLFDDLDADGDHDAPPESQPPAGDQPHA